MEVKNLISRNSRPATFWQAYIIGHWSGSTKQCWSGQQKYKTFGVSP